MPNWCNCELYVCGETKEVQKFREAVRKDDEVLSANRIIPYPEDFAVLDKFCPFHARVKGNAPIEMPEELKQKLIAKGYDPKQDGFNQGGYEWCIKNWGTKWGFCDSKIVSEREYESNTTLEYAFDTAWSPPKPLIVKLGEMFPALEIELRYFECGVGFNGLFCMKNGVVETDKESLYFGHRGG